MKNRRVVVTGMGIVSCHGNDVETFYDALLAGKSGIVPIQEFPCSDWPTRFAGSVPPFDPGDLIEKKAARRVDPFIRYTLVAGKKALEHGKLDLGAIDKKRAGVIIGSGMGGMTVFYEGVENLLTKSYRRITPFFVPYIITNMGGALLAIDIGFTGPNYSMSTACATANYCIHAAAEHIRRGEADLILAGGSEAPINPIGVAGFVAIKALSTRNDAPEKASRPWDRSRDGFVMGEGSGVLMLESLDHALARGAPIYAELLGSSINCDASHMTDPIEDGSRVAECIEEALKNGEIDKKRVNYVNAHATSTLAGDLCEIRALKRVFGPQVQAIKINATKSLTGHCLGAAGGIEAIATIQAIRRGKLHPTLNLDDPDPELDGIDAVAHHSIDHTVDVALSNSFGFGGHNSTLVFAAYHGR